MVYSPIMNAFRLSPEEAGGQPDYINALKKGFEASNVGAEAAYRPKNLAEALLRSQLENKIKGSEANYADRLNQSLLAQRGASTSLSQATIDKYKQDAEQAAWKRNLLNEALKQYGQGQGGMSQQGDQNVSAPVRSGINPIYAGLLKKDLGIDVNYETPEQKTQNTLELGRRSKQAESAESLLHDLQNEIQATQQVEEILKRPESRNLTGLVPWAKSLIGAGNPSLLELNAPLSTLQQAEAHKFGSRGGVGVAGLAENIKPSLKKTTKQNLSSVIGLKKKFIDEFNQESQRYERATGQKYPYEIPKEWTHTRVYYKGKPHLVPNEHVQQAISAGGSLNG